MPYVNVPNDLSKIKTKIAFNLTKRQLICFGIGAAIGIPTYLLTRQAIGKTIASHVEAIGGTIVDNERPDLLLAVNTPLTTTTTASASSLMPIAAR